MNTSVHQEYQSVILQDVFPATAFFFLAKIGKILIGKWIGGHNKIRESQSDAIYLNVLGVIIPRCHDDTASSTSIYNYRSSAFGVIANNNCGFVVLPFDMQLVDASTEFITGVGTFSGLYLMLFLLSLSMNYRYIPHMTICVISDLLTIIVSFHSC